MLRTPAPFIGALGLARNHYKCEPTLETQCHPIGMRMSAFHEGGCLCGQIRYRTLGEPSRTLVCHCTFCQKFTGSSFNVESMFPSEAVEFFGSPMSRYEHRCDEGSGKLAHIYFCSTCGTTVSLTFERSPGTRCILRGTFDDPNWVSVTANIWTRSAQTGIALPADTDCYREARLSPDGTLGVAERFRHPVMAVSK